jgi:transposase
VDTSDVLETGSMAKRKRRKFTAEYKAEVVGLIDASGKGVGQVAKELDLTETSVRAWVKRFRIDGKRDPHGPLTSEERAELTRVKRELKTATQERDFLKKAAAFFARSGR